MAVCEIPPANEPATKRSCTASSRSTSPESQTEETVDFMEGGRKQTDGLKIVIDFHVLSPKTIFSIDQLSVFLELGQKTSVKFLD